MEVKRGARGFTWHNVLFVIVLGALAALAVFGCGGSTTGPPTFMITSTPTPTRTPSATSTLRATSTRTAAAPTFTPTPTVRPTPFVASPTPTAVPSPSTAPTPSATPTATPVPPFACKQTTGIGEGNDAALALGAGDYVAMAYDTLNTAGFTDTVSAIRFSDSSDSGTTWSKFVTVVNDGDLNAGPSIAVDTHSNAWVSWWDGTSAAIKVSKRKADGTFSPPVVIAPITFNTVSLFHAASNSLAVDSTSGELYDALQGSAGGSDPLLMRSSDGGATWSPGAGFASTVGSNPALAVDALGRLYLTYNVLTGSPLGSVAARAVSYSTDGGTAFSAPSLIHIASDTFRELEYRAGNLILSPDGSTFADFGEEFSACFRCPPSEVSFVDLGSFGQSSAFQEQVLTNPIIGEFFPINGFFHSGGLFGLALGPPFDSGLPSFDLVQAAPGGPLLSWPLGIPNVQQIFTASTTAGAVFATRQGDIPGFVVAGVCQ